MKKHTHPSAPDGMYSQLVDEDLPASQFIHDVQPRGASAGSGSGIVVSTARTVVFVSAGWLSFEGSCYRVSRQTANWRGGQRLCQRDGGQLAVILSAHQQGFLWDLLPRGYWNAFWFGLSDQHTEDVWTWVDGTPLVGGFWEEGEPNNHNNEDCGYMVKTLDLERVAVRSWYDAPCYMSLPFICQKVPGTGPPIAPTSH
ncbi:unnamed protein product [Arctogadus glacialis]